MLPRQTVLLLTVLLCLVGQGFGENKRFLFFSSGPRLDQYNVDKSQISVSGISSGAAFASQYHVIFSSHVMGVGMIAGVPFACSGGNAVTGLGVCMKTPALVSATALEALTVSGAALGNVDATSNMAHDKVYIFNGKVDSVVNPGIGPVIESYYQHFVTEPGNIKTVFNISAEHSQPTDNYGGPCGALNTADYLNNCHYSAAFDLLNHIYGGNLRKPTPDTRAIGQLMEFDRGAFFNFAPASFYSMDNSGFIYVPRGCMDKSTKCKLHIAFHGCQMGKDQIGDKYARHAGYNEVGELNNIIILYPQVVVTATNPQGCWDWYGYTGTLFATNSGFQETAVKRMMNRVTG